MSEVCPDGRANRESPIKKRRAKLIAILPTMLTLGNAVCGFGAITFEAKWINWSPDASLFAASCLIFLAMVFDAVDGSTARWANETSEFGAQLDSLCDAISFGVAPALLMLQFSLSYGYHPRLLWLIAALYVVCTVLRLARFNVETEEDNAHRFFSGLPSPAAAGTVASIPIMVFGLKQLDVTDQSHLREGISTWFDSAAGWILPLITFAVACLMVSRVRYSHLVSHMVGGRRSGQHLIRLVFAVAVIFVLPQISVPLLFCWYVFAPPVRALWFKRIAKVMTNRQNRLSSMDIKLPR